MRKQTKLVAVLSAAALLALGASMTSFAAGWEKDESGIWHYYDEDDELVTDEWKKDGGKWFYLDEDGDMLINDWVDDDYYVGEDGAMLVNEWVKTYSDEDQDDPDEDGEHWYYFGSKGKKVVDDDKKINGKTYYFNEDGEMLSGWQEIGGEAYYLGGEDEGWRAESQWLWLEKSGLVDDDEDDDTDGMRVLGCDEDDDCDDEGWYWFGSSGKATHQAAKKKINGKWYMFNEHGQMLYEWIDNDTSVKRGSNAQLDDTTIASGAQLPASIASMLYYNDVEDGSRANGWYQLDGAKDVGTDSDTDWYYIDDGEVTYADSSKDFATWDEDGYPVYVTREKINGKYFAFNEVGQMQDGLQFIADDNGFYFFDADGYQKTGKVSNVECDDDDYNFYFNTTNGKNGQGYKGEKDGYLYFNGKRLEADDDYRLYYYNGDVYLVNTKGKIQKAKSGKEYDIENAGSVNGEDVKVVTDKNGKVESVAGKSVETLITELEGQLAKSNEAVMEDTVISVPFISLYDDDIYTYELDEDGKLTNNLGWLELNFNTKTSKLIY
ncbi:MAG: glucan-binding protein [Clostridiaceae bacterium]|nr:glucan-binding protein [Clostridiaceae bacterium]